MSNSEKNDKVFKDFIASYPFIYKIKDHLYYIGYGVFEKCNEEDSELYIQYIREWEDLLKIKYNIQKSDIVNIKRIFNFIKEHGKKIKIDTKKHSDIDKFIEKLSDKELDDLILQKKKYIETINFSDGVIYRFKTEELQ